MKKKKLLKFIKGSLITIVVLMIIGFVLFYNYTLDYYRAEPIAVEILNTDEDIVTYEEFLAFEPNNKNDIGIIFYQGGKVENIAYLPLLQKLKMEGYTTVLTKAPFNLAIFDKDMADEVYDMFPNINKWYIMGHSLGGATASMYVSENSEKVDGLILLGAYIYGDYSPSNTLTVYGEFNSNLEEDMDYEENIVKIPGGNHAYFGNYGEQKGDAKATITQDEQQDATVKAIIEFTNN